MNPTRIIGVATRNCALSPTLPASMSAVTIAPATTRMLRIPVRIQNSAPPRTRTTSKTEAMIQGAAPST